MKTPAKILVIDDVPRNVKLLADLLTAIRTQLKRRLIAFGVEMGLKNPKSAEAILLQRCSKEATLCPISHMLN